MRTAGNGPSPSGSVSVPASGGSPATAMGRSRTVGSADHVGERLGIGRADQQDVVALTLEGDADGGLILADAHEGALARPPPGAHVANARQGESGSPQAAHG